MQFVFDNLPETSLSFHASNKSHLVAPITWQAPSSVAKSFCRAFCSVQGRVRRADERRSLLSSHEHSPSDLGSAPDGRPGPR